jgi:hypothetical protein
MIVFIIQFLLQNKNYLIRRPCRMDQDPPGPCPIRCKSPNNTDQDLC